jgi:hypothetical protein
VRGSSRLGDRPAAKELALAKLLKLSKKFVSHSSGPSCASGGSAAPALARALDLFDSGSFASDAEPTDPLPLKTISKPSEALATKGTLEQFLFLRLS